MVVVANVSHEMDMVMGMIRETLVVQEGSVGFGGEGMTMAN